MKGLKQKSRSWSPKDFIINNWPIWVVILTVILFFWKVFFKGLVPLPADFLVGTYYPWLDYNWGYAVGVPVKNPITTDVVSFSYPMRILAIDLMRQGLWPLWNRFILAGIPLLANFQSAPFTFTNLFYLFFGNVDGWSIQVISQHFFAMLFMYILLKHWKVSKTAALTGGALYAFSGFNLIWSQWNSHTLTAAFIPLLIYLTDKIRSEENIVWCVIFSISIALQIFSGYPQAVFYTAIILAVYWLFNFENNRNFFSKTLKIAIFGLAGLLLAMPQILPARELLNFSQRAIEPLEFDWAFLPWIKSITLLAPDFFGNHATKNYWGPGDYTMNTGYVGVVAVALSLIAIKHFITNNKKVKFALILSIISLVLSFPTPISVYIWKSGIFGFQAASAHRAQLIFIFSISLLVAYGSDVLAEKLTESKIKILAPIALLLGVYTLISFYSYAADTYSTVFIDFKDKVNVTVSLRNLILPWFFFISVSLLIFISNKLPKKVIYILIYFLVVTEIFRFGWKYTPFSKRNLVYPDTPITAYLKEQEEPFRVTGADVIPINIRMQYRLESLEGYDAIYPVNIAKFIAVTNSENIDAAPQGRYGTVSNKYSKLLNLANTKYILNIENDNYKYLPPTDEGIKKVFSDQSVVIYENENVLPRAYFVNSWEYMEDDKEILRELLNEDFDFREKILISGKGDEFNSENDAVSDVSYIKYGDMESLIKVANESEGYLFISDADYPGWKAYIDDEKAELERADYAFRALKVPKGDHVVKITYEPESFFKGLKISLVVLITLILTLIFSFVNKGTVSYTSHSPNDKK